VEALTTLSLRGDATVQEYMANLRVGRGLRGRGAAESAAADRVMAARLCVRWCGRSTLTSPFLLLALQAMANDLRAAEMRAGDMAAELGAARDEAGSWRAEAEQLRGLLRAVDSDRDAAHVGTSGGPGARLGTEIPHGSFPSPSIMPSPVAWGYQALPCPGPPADPRSPLAPALAPCPCPVPPPPVMAPCHCQSELDAKAEDLAGLEARAAELGVRAEEAGRCGRAGRAGAASWAVRRPAQRVRCDCGARALRARTAAPPNAHCVVAPMALRLLAMAEGRLAASEARAREAEAQV
jgi:hypothetical protein